MLRGFRAEGMTVFRRFLPNVLTINGDLANEMPLGSLLCLELRSRLFGGRQQTHSAC